MMPFLFSLLCTLPLFAQTPYENVERLPFDPHGWLAPENAQELSTLIHSRNIQTVVEVGSGLGLATRHIATLLPSSGKLYAIDQWSEKPNETYCTYQQFLSNILHANLSHLISPLPLDFRTPPPPFPEQIDLVYLNLSHDEGTIYQELEQWYPYVRDQGVLCGDSWAWLNARSTILQFCNEHNLYVWTHGNFWKLTTLPNPTPIQTTPPPPAPPPAPTPTPTAPPSPPPPSLSQRHWKKTKTKSKSKRPRHKHKVPRR